ncbi:MAG: phosphopentomutase [Nitrospirae bacterium]|nr:phosphopentomutase [Nitrospirota bacterium]
MALTLIILDGLGIGELPDAKEYNDEGSNTLGNMAKAAGGITLPNLEKFGIGNLGEFKGIKKIKDSIASFGRMREASKGKDTTTGHWEMAGIILNNPFPTYPNGFPPEIIDPFKKKIGRDILCNRPASGTEIIKELGEEHIKTGCPIVYTSADSVFQIAAHEEVIPVDQLYKMCEIARGLLIYPHNVCRVIARPFIGAPNKFIRTERRRDFSLPPPHKTLLDILKASRIPVASIGKIDDIFAGMGISESVHTKDNADGIKKTIEMMEKIKHGLIFVNLNDYDTKYGHRNDAEGYAKALIEFDNELPNITNKMRNNDILVITADHGCDPTTPSTDHSREYVPLLIYGKKVKGGVDLGVRETFADLGQTIAEIFNVERLMAGESFWGEIKRE